MLEVVEVVMVMVEEEDEEEIVAAAEVVVELEVIDDVKLLELEAVVVTALPAISFAPRTSFLIADPTLLLR